MGKIQIRIILEILGRPKENVSEALHMLVKKLSSEQGIRIIGSDIHEPVKVKDAKDLFTSFAEVTLELDSINAVFGILFSYMPANAEFISPELIELRNDSFNSTINRLLQRLHNYDAIAKKMIIERDFLLKKLKEASPSLFKSSDIAQIAVQVNSSKKRKNKEKIGKKKQIKKKKINQSIFLSAFAILFFNGSSLLPFLYLI